MAFPEVGVAVRTLQAVTDTACKETSPDSKCPICLDHFRNVSYADRCFHRFCFRCILEWGKNKAECPLCKQPFGSVYHSVRSEDDFKVYELRPAENGSFGSVQGRRFRYRTTVTHERRREGRTRRSSHRQELVRFRRWLYRRGVRVRGVRDGGRSRDTSAEFFRKNPACLHRLVPWLKRELAVLYGSHDSVADVVLHVILSLITRHDMQNEAFLQELRPFLSSRTEHFLHEFLSFAKSPFNMEAYDRHAVYDCPAPSHLSALSEDEADLSSAPSPWDDETPGPSYSSSTQRVFTVTISDSDDSVSEEEEEEETVSINADDPANGDLREARVDEDDHGSDRDCIIIGFIKPTAQRTPELVQLSSDSEVSVQDEPGPSTYNQSDARDPTNRRSRNTGVTPSHPATEHSSKSQHRDRDRERDWGYSSHSHRRRSRSLSYEDRRRRRRSSSKPTNRSSPSHTFSHSRHRYRDTRYTRDTPPPSRARSRSKTRSRSRSRTHLFSRYRSHSYSGSRSRTRSYSGLWRTQDCLQNRKHSERLSVRPSPSSHRRASRDKPCGTRKHKSLHREKRRRSREKHHHHHPKKKKKRRRRSRRSSSVEEGAERRNLHTKQKKKHKHKTVRKDRSERTGRGSGASSPAVITIHTDTQSAEEATPPRGAASADIQPLDSSRGAPTTCPNATPAKRAASNAAPDKTLSSDLPASSHTPSHATPADSLHLAPAPSQCSHTDLLL